MYSSLFVKALRKCLFLMSLRLTVLGPFQSILNIRPNPIPHYNHANHSSPLGCRGTIQFLKEFHSGASRVFGYPGLTNVPHEDRKTRRKGYYKYLLFCSNNSVKLFVCEKKIYIFLGYSCFSVRTCVSNRCTINEVLMHALPLLSR